MRIINLEVSNYRNLDGICINFEPKIDFLVGENELGKSNLLSMLDAIFNRHQFLIDDFYQKNKPIIIKIGLQLSDTEKGAFDDYFDPSNDNNLHIIALQEYTDFDEHITFCWDVANGGSDPMVIPSSLFNKLNYIYYDTLRSPQQELTFYKGKGSGKFLSFLINQYANTSTIVNIDVAMAPITDSIQFVFDRLRPLKKQGLGLFTDKENVADFAARVLKLNGQDGFELQKSGYGVQFCALLLLTILERLAELRQNKRFRPFEEKREYFSAAEFEIFRDMYLIQDKEIESIIKPIIRNEKDKYFIDIEKIMDDPKIILSPAIIDHIRIRKHISMVLGLDEPEIHLHPYMQRSLIKYVDDLINNGDKEFSYLLKKIFDIDVIDGQLIIVSHSPTILLDQYKHIIRFYRNGQIEAISGSSLRLDWNLEKHLLLCFPYIKEAFFSRCVIVVEGETELGAFPLWAGKIIGNLDEMGITVVKVGSNTSIPPVVCLLNHFKIPNVSVIDKDDNNDKLSKYTSVCGLEITYYRDFEEELFERVFSIDSQIQILFDFEKTYDDKGMDRCIQKNKLDDISSTYNIQKSWDLEKSQFSFYEAKELGDSNLNKTMFLSWMGILKTVTFGRALGECIEMNMIPLIYQQLIISANNKAVQK
jgi:putative ATP-dependent endonuclease of OLD family